MKKRNYPLTLVALLLISCFISSVSFTQVPDDFPVLNVSKTGETAPGYVFLTVSRDVEGVGYYIFMLGDDETPVHYKKLPEKHAYDFKMQPNGLMSYAQLLESLTYTGGGNAVHMIIDENMNPVDSFQLKNGYIAEIHDFQLLPNGHALVFGYYLTQMDLSDIVDGGYPNARVSGGIVQELDQDKNVVWQWRTWDKYDHTEYDFGNNSDQQTLSEFHLNTMNLDSDGHMFLGTPSWTKKVNRQTGEIMWHLGGDENEFSFVGVDSLEGVNDVAGHAFHRMENGHVLVYDNGSRDGSEPSAAHEYHLDEENKIATKIKTISHPSDVSGRNQGSAQRLPNGNTLIGWGGAGGDPIPTCTEFDSLGNVVFEVAFDNPDIESYRAVRFPFPPEAKHEATEEEVGPENTYDFLQGDTLDIGVDIEINEITTVGYNDLTVTTHDYAPRFPEFDQRSPAVIPQKIVLSEFSINYIEGDLIIDVDMFDIPDPEEITIYARETEGEGTFPPLTTDYNSVTGELTATFDHVGEFILTYPDIPHQVIDPQTLKPENEAWVNYQLPVKLEWIQDGFFNHFDLQVATDESFNNVVVDQTTLKSTVHELTDLPVNQTYFWRVKTHNDAGESNWSDVSTFTTIAPYLELTAPNGDEVWNRGLDYFVEWDGNIDGEVILDLYKDNTHILTIDTVSHNNAYLWTLPSELDSTCNYHISVTSRENEAVYDMSDISFAVNDSSCSGVEVPFVKVTAPNGGETVDKSGPVDITWGNTTGEPVTVALYRNGTSVKTLFSGINENNVSWNIGEDVETGDNYRIMVSSEGSLALDDASNGDFGITDSNEVDIQPVIDESIGFTIYPNPVKDVLHIEYSLDEASPVTIQLFNMQGKQVATLLAETKRSGDHQIDYNMGNWPTGIYFIQMKHHGKLKTMSFNYLK